MSVLDYRVQQILKHLIGLLISGHTANSHDERVSWDGDTENELNM